MNTLNVVRKLALQAGVVAIAISASTVEAHAQNVSRSSSSRVSIDQPNVSTLEVEVPEVEVPEVEAPVTISSDTSGGAVAVPEPSTAAGLLVISAVGAGVMWRRKKSVG